MPNVPNDSPTPESALQQGRRMACEGILRSRFGQRPSAAVSKAIEILRETEGKARIVSFPRVERARRLVRFGMGW